MKTNRTTNDKNTNSYPSKWKKFYFYTLKKRRRDCLNRLQILFRRFDWMAKRGF
jgi:hypothetical protein